MNENDFRKAYVEKYSQCKNALTGSEYALLLHVKRYKHVTALRVSGVTFISVQCAGTRLKKLADKGYLQRVNVTDPTGGRMFEYSLPRYLRGE